MKKKEKKKKNLTMVLYISNLYVHSGGRQKAGVVILGGWNGQTVWDVMGMLLFGLRMNLTMDRKT